MKIMKEVTVAIAISGGKYLTAVNRGGMGEKENLLSIHTDAKAIGPWEEFSFEKCDDTHVAIKTGSGKYLSIKSNNNTDPGNAFPVHTDAVWIREWERFTLCYLENGKYALRTASGNYVTFVNNGGMSDKHLQLSTDARTITPKEKVQVILVP